MEAHAAQHGAGQAVAARAVDRDVAEECQDRKAEHAHELADRTEIERDDEEADVDRHQQRDRDQKTDQQFDRRAGVFETFIQHLGVGPEETAHIGREPEAVDAERDEEQQRAAGE